jgi:purine-binding chemotaxis protein CheW
MNLVNNTAAAAREVLAFHVGAEEYGVDIHAVQELRGYDAVTRLANAPEMLKGVLNLRGVIVPIIDLRIRFGCAKVTYDQFTVVVILNIGAQIVGMVVDSVADVISLSGDQCKPAPQVGGGIDHAHVTGIGAIDGRLLVLLDIECLYASLHLPQLEQLAA